MIVVGNKACNEAIFSLFKITYILGKKTIRYYKFSALCEMLLFVNANIITKLYYDAKVFAEIL